MTESGIRLSADSDCNKYGATAHQNIRKFLAYLLREVSDLEDSF